MLKTLRRKASSFAGHPLFTKLWLVPLWCVLGLAKAAIFTVSFRQLAPRLGVPSGVAPWVPLLDTRQRMRARQIAKAIRIASRYTPWNSNCFPQAIAARLLLGLYDVPFTLFFGVATDPHRGELRAHTWVMAGPVAVTGHSSFGSYTVVGVFASRRVVLA